MHEQEPSRCEGLSPTPLIDEMAPRIRLDPRTKTVEAAYHGEFLALPLHRNAQ